MAREVGETPPAISTTGGNYVPLTASSVVRSACTSERRDFSLLLFKERVRRGVKMARRGRIEGGGLTSRWRASPAPASARPAVTDTFEKGGERSWILSIGRRACAAGRASCERSDHAGTLLPSCSMARSIPVVLVVTLVRQATLRSPAGTTHGK